VNILADMEIWGIGVDMEGCLRARHVLARKLKLLEKEAYRLAGKTFSLSMPADIANIMLSMRAQKYTTLHGHWLQTSLATGLPMEEPKLQCVEHMVEFRMNEDGGESCVDHYKINAHDFFVPTQEDWVLLTADYCQIELRLMAHFSKDYSLIELLTSPQAEIFTLIASKWKGKHESSVIGSFLSVVLVLAQLLFHSAQFLNN
ncbi:mammalian DNA polymerase-like protein, partial [Perilla frutescens var. hirtella]